MNHDTEHYADWLEDHINELQSGFLEDSTFENGIKILLGALDPHSLFHESLDFRKFCREAYEEASSKFEADNN